MGLRVGMLVNRDHQRSDGNHWAQAGARHRRGVDDVESSRKAMTMVRPMCGATSLGLVLHGDEDAADAVRTRLAGSKRHANFAA